MTVPGPRRGPAIRLGTPSGRSEFWKVERMPEAAPRWRAGTLPMTADELGAPNRPTPIPLTTISRAKAQ